MAGLTGIQPLQGYWVVDNPEASAEVRLGGPADPRHGQAFQAEPERVPWALQAWALVPTTPADPGGYPDESREAQSVPIGTVSGPDTAYFDATPQTHAGPWPKGVYQGIGPDESSARAATSAALHADGLDNAKGFLSIHALQDNWVEYWNPDDANRNLQLPVNGQVRQAAGGFGSTDAVSNPDGHNEYGLGNAHLHRRVAASSIPGNYLWLPGAGRPMVKSVAGPARPPVGEGPFEGQSLTQNWSTQGAVLQDPAGEYVSPPDPYQAPASALSAATAPGPVAWW